jgi:hypothetical protein
MRLLLSESVDWKLDVIDSYEEISPNDFYLNKEVNARKGDNLKHITYLAFLESTNEAGSKFGITVRVELIINNRSGIAWIDWIGKGPNRHNNTDKTPSYANLRHLLSQIAKNHPYIQFFSGDRVSGMHKKFGKPEFKLRTNKL